MLTPAVFVLEKSPHWELGLKEHLASKTCLVRPCRSVRDVTELAKGAPQSVVVIAWDQFPSDGWQALLALCSPSIAASVVVIASDEWFALEWTIRDAGAVQFLPVTTTNEQLAKVCRKLLPQYDNAERI